MMTTTTNAENLRQYQSRFSLTVEQILAVAWSTKLLEKLRIYLQVSNELNNDILRYRQFSFELIDPCYCKTLISSSKNMFR